MEPRQIIADRAMSRMQWIAVAICVALNALDGFDVLSISFASPGIATEWGIDRAALGVVLSMELIGMAVGSVLLGNLTDRIGRRPMILACLLLMVAGMALATTSTSVIMLALWRLATGLGIGGMLAAVNAMAAEVSNAHRKSLSVALMAAGYPMGAVVGGSIASALLVGGDWRLVFLLGAGMTAALVPVVWFLMPETVAYLDHRRPLDALARINRVLTRFGHPTVATLPPPRPAERASIARLFAPGIARTTILLALAYFAHVLTFYFIIKWIPKIVVDLGHAPSAAGGVLVWANVGGATGALVLGLMSMRLPLKKLTLVGMAASVVLVVLFGQVGDGLGELALVAAIAGFATNAVIVGLYAIIARAFPTSLRAGGTGFVIGVGRGGSALAPIVAGILFSKGFGLPVVAATMACGSLLAFFLLLALRYDEARLHD